MVVRGGNSYHFWSEVGGIRAQVDMTSHFCYIYAMSTTTSPREEARNVQVKAAVYPSEKARIEQVACQKGISVSDLLRDLVMAEVKAHETKRKRKAKAD